jgi:outer membrane biosynthesis protein TonB
MTRFAKFITISLLLHLSLFFILIDINPFDSDGGLMLGSIYEVSIVSEEDMASAIGNSQPWQKIIRENSEKAKELPDATKEISAQEKISDFSLGKIEPPKTESTSRSDYSSSIIKSFDKKTENTTKTSTDTLSTSKPSGKGGSSKTQDKQIGIYKAKVKEIIRRHWKTPPEVAFSRKTLKSTYMMSIVKNGEIVDKKMISSSGNTSFDSSILAALNSVERLPAPPSLLIEDARTLDIVITFTSEELR